MGKVYLICGKICSGKSYYAKLLKEKYTAVILSTDEATYELINNEQGEFYNIFAQRVNNYLKKKAAEICKAGANVILDWGFWTKENRTDISSYLKSQDVSYEWHYIDVDDATWNRNIEERNKRIEEGNGGSDFYVDEGLLNKLLSMFEIPEKAEMDVWYELNR
ncbi:AAA family ATPase [Butyrivibrio sp. WCE2006]|uniref:AAA family ATPase n=1 Tax=Butyrivibrio sp. WCE2006 TaxID=1410611 RepID=UPI0005D25863|nr:ATP-binding protein [Butyrivibrio sp. WCE2006]